jgi:hypothetical protein
VPAYSAREHDAFQVTSLLDKVVYLVAVRYTGDVLLDDRPLVQLLRDVVAGGPNQFYAALECGMIGLGAGKSGKKGVVDVDDSFRKTTYELRRQNLHVAGQDDEINVTILEQVDLPRFHLEFVRGGKREMVEGNTVESSQGLCVWMIADDEGYIARQFSNLVSVQQVNQTMLVARNEDRNSQAMSGPCQPPYHPEFVGQASKLLPEGSFIEVEAIERPLDPHEEFSGLIVLVLVRMQYVAAMGIKKLGNGGHQAGAVRAID